MLTANPRRCDSIALTKSLPIAAQRLFRAGLALSVTCGDTSPKGRGFGSRHRFLYLFGELYVIMVLRFTPRISRERRWTRWPIFSHFWYLSEQM